METEPLFVLGSEQLLFTSAGGCNSDDNWKDVIGPSFYYDMGLEIMGSAFLYLALSTASLKLQILFSS